MTAPSSLPADSIRGRIREFIERHAASLGDDVLEVGSLCLPGAWWMTARDLAQGKWLGIDMRPGAGVDEVRNIAALPAEWSGRFTGVLCSEVLEHVERPWRAVPELFRVLRPGGWIVVTVPFGFHRHAFPSDYYRYTGDGLGVLLGDAGFEGYAYEYHGSHVLRVKDHDENAVDTVIETQLFATARKPGSA